MNNRLYSLISFFFINAANAHGGDPTSDLIGDFHTISNIEAYEIT
jgi:hypothetical protein